MMWLATMGVHLQNGIRMAASKPQPKPRPLEDQVQATEEVIKLA
jgi:hypothetical protein